MERENSLLGCLLRFCTVGTLATAVYFVLANLFIQLNIASVETCSVLAYMVGIVVSYIGQSGYTFRVEVKNRGQILRFSVLSAIGVCISYLSVVIAVNIYNVDAVWGTLVTSVSIPLLSFIMMKLWVFKYE